MKMSEYPHEKELVLLEMLSERWRATHPPSRCRYGEHGAGGFVVEGGARAFNTFKASHPNMRAA